VSLQQHQKNDSAVLLAVLGAGLSRDMPIKVRWVLDCLPLNTLEMALADVMLLVFSLSCIIKS